MSAAVDNLDFHGVKDFKRAGKLAKVMWGIVLMASLAACALQLHQVTIDFIADGAGTVQQSYLPRSLPAVMVCPKFRAFRPFAETGVTEDQYKYMLGYAMQTGSLQYKMHRGWGFPAQVGEEAKKHLARFNGSITRMVESLALDPKTIFRSYSSFPGMGAPVKFGLVVNIGFICYTAEVDMKVDATTAEVAEVRFPLLTHQKSFDEFAPTSLYNLFIGNDANWALRIQLGDAIDVKAGDFAQIRFRAARNIRYAGRAGNRCRAWTKSDYDHCSLQVAAAKSCGGPGDCQLFIPKTPAYPERSSDPCNVFDYALGCYMKPFFSSQLREDIEATVNAQCPVPCEETVYDSKIKTINNGTYITVGLKFDSVPFFKIIREYPLASVADFLAAIGGTAGLWFGASVLSIFQIIFFFGEVSCKRGNKAHVLEEV